jgi:hypothetical protein
LELLDYIYRKYAVSSGKNVCLAVWALVLCHGQTDSIVRGVNAISALLECYAGQVFLDFSYNRKPTRCTISQFYFGKELYMFRTDLLSIIRSLNPLALELDIYSSAHHLCKM